MGGFEGGGRGRVRRRGREGSDGGIVFFFFNEEEDNIGKPKPDIAEGDCIGSYLRSLSLPMPGDRLFFFSFFLCR